MKTDSVKTDEEKKRTDNFSTQIKNKINNKIGLLYFNGMTS